MKKGKLSGAEELRKKAEEKVKQKFPSKEALRSWMSEPEALKLLHELEVHHVELEMQNEELIMAKTQLAESVDKYAELYDFAPSGYFTLTQAGKITEANLTGSLMLGKVRSRLIGTSFISYFPNENKPVFNQFLLGVFNSPEKKSCELSSIEKGGSRMFFYVTGIAIEESKNCQLSVVDITERVRSEENLVKNKALLETAEENAKIGGWVFDVSTLSQTWTKETFRILEMDGSKGEPEVPKGLGFVDQPYRLMAENAVQAAIKQGIPYDQEWIITTARGNKRWVHAVAKVSKENGKVVKVFGSLQDITDRKLVVEAKEDSEASMRSLIENVAEVFLRFSPDLRIQYVSPRISKFLPVEPGDLLGKTNEEAGFSKEMSHLFDTAVSQVILSGKPLDMEFEIMGKEGVLQAESRVYPEVDQHGKVKAVVSVSREISARRRLEIAIRESEERYRTILEQSGDAVFLHDVTGRILEVNLRACENLGYSREELTTLGISDIDPDAILNDKHLLWEKVLAGERFTFESRQLRKDGSTFPVEVTIGSVRLLKGNAVLGIVRDISERKQTEEKIEKIGRRFQALIENAQDGVVLINSRGQFTYASPAARRMFGFGATDEITIGPNDNTHPDDLPMVLSNLGRLIEDPTFIPVLQYRFSGKEGNWRWIESTFTNLLADPFVESIVINFRDITETYEAEEALRKSEERYHSLYMNMVEGAALHEVVYNDQGVAMDYVIIDVNPGFEKLLGLSRDTVIGKRSTEVYGVVDPPFLETYAQVALTCNPVVFETYFPPLEKHFSISVYCPAKGRFATIFEDITKRKLTESALRQSEEFNRRMVETANEGIWAMNKDHKTNFVNQKLAEMLGYTTDEMQGRPVSAFMFPEDIEDHDARMAERRSGVPGNYERRFRQKNGQEVWFAVSSVPVFDKDGVFDGSFGMFQNITMRRLAEKALQESESKYHKLSTLLRLMSDTMPDMIWAKDLNKEYIFANKAICNTLLNATDTDEPIGKTDVFFARRERESHKNNPQWHTFGELCMDSDTITLQEMKEMQFYEHGNVKGEYLYLDVNKAPMFNAEGELIGVVGSARDITKQKQAEEALRESQENLLDIFATVKEGIAYTNLAGKVISINSSLENMLELKKEDVIGKNLLSLAKDFLSVKNFKSVFPVLSKLIQGEPIDVFQVDYKNKVLELNTNINRQTRMLTGVVRDITMQRQAEEALRESEKTFSEIFHKSPVTIILTTPYEGVFLDVNDTFLRDMEYTREEVIGHTTRELGIFDNLNDREQLTRLLKDQGYVFGVECSFRSKRGKIMLGLVSIVFIKLKGRVCQLSTVIDISQRKQVEEELAKQNIALSNLNRLSVELSMLSAESHPEAKIARRLKEISGAVAVIFSEYDAITKCTKVKHIELEPGLLEKVVHLLNNKVSSFTSFVSDEKYHEITKQIIGSVKSLYDASFHTIARPVSAAVQKLLKVDRFIGLAYMVDGKLYGTSLLAMGKGVPDPPKEVLENFISMVAVTLRRKRAEEDLQKREEHFRTLFEQATDGIFISDKNGYYLDVNSFGCEMMGYTRDEITKLSILDIITEDELDRIKPTIESIQQDEVVKSEWKFRRKNGSTFLGEVTTKKLPYGRLQAFVRDITDRRQAEEKLKESEALFSTTFHSSPIPISLTDMATEKWMEVNEAFLDITGFTRDIIIGKTFQEIKLWRNPEDREKMKELLLRDGHVRNFEVDIHKKGNKLGTMLISVEKVDLVGKPYLLIMGNEITDRKLVESELQFRNLLLTTEQEVSIDGILVVDGGEMILTYNRRFVEMWKVPNELIEAKIDEPVLAHVASHMSDPEAFYKRSQFLNENRHEISHDELLLKDGRIIERYSAPMVGSDGQFFGRVWYFRDITDRKKTELALQESEEKFRSITEQTISFIALTDSNGVITYSSSASNVVFLASPEEMCGRHFGEFIDESSAQVGLAAFRQVLEQGERTKDLEVLLKRKDGSLFTAEVNATQFKAGDHRGTLVVINDITLRKNAEKELITAKEQAEEGDRLKTAFLQNISHEVRTPMNAIIGFSRMLDRQDLTQEKRIGFTNIIIQSAEQLLSIVNDIITISSLETKQEKLNFQKVCINNIIDGLFDIFKLQASNQGILFSVQKPLTDEQSEIVTDKTKITQILSNLLTNSFKFTHVGFIEMGYQLKDKYLEFFVKDSGIGIQQEMQDVIFDRFRQADLSISKNYGGTGLGLAISKGFSELMGGRIWVESELDKGSAFYFTIPYRQVG